ncbi:DUF4352 domain-containing protein [Caldisalinibacter kiritimatiensis]|uniref:DUF4352 domain-containing protein n=1 Tax=Caldisalinibacter kiritimatiensis TaxID=1304284 RepID=R1CU37_9FIRM|nr:DUF4352 domain-containing protein [Caldisalinibacter kiritimatiensis]EOD00199.1 hypothetical protein L21TH_1775 [Caldisalinibacter kiritimatiensis]
MKKILKWIGIVFVGLIIIGAIAGGGEEGSDNNTSSNESTTQEASSESTTETKTAEEPVTEEYFKIGDVVKVGNLEYTVNEVLQADKLGNEYLNEEANGVFLILNVTVTNRDKEGRTIDSAMFKLIESDGTEYDSNGSAAIYIEGNDDFFLAQVNPKLSKTGYIVFDVPTVDSSYALKVTGGFWSSEEELIYLTNE